MRDESGKISCVHIPEVGIQIIASGPDTMYRQIRDNYLELFHKARKHIYIQTPYFVPDDAVLSALQIAARSGVEVMLMIPCKPDHPFVYWATYSYVATFSEQGPGALPMRRDFSTPRASAQTARCAVMARPTWISAALN